MRAGNRGTRWASAVILSVAVASATVAAQTKSSIKVHGHWTLDVRNADGTLASHREFDNHLTPEGGELLAKFLQGSAVVRDLVVEVDGGQKPCATQRSCLIVPSAPEFTDPNSFLSAAKNPNISVTLSVGAQTAVPAKLVLAGLATTTGGTIGLVRTVVIPQCPMAPAVCDPSIQHLGGGGNLSSLFIPLTEISLQGPEMVVTFGQVVSVSVTLTFTS